MRTDDTSIGLIALGAIGFGALVALVLAPLFPEYGDLFAWIVARF